MEHITEDRRTLDAAVRLITEEKRKLNEVISAVAFAADKLPEKYRRIFFDAYISYES
jgi:hypothetical protein